MGVLRLLNGKNIILRAIDKDDLKILASIFNDPKVKEFDLSYLAAFSHEQMENEFEDDIKKSLKSNEKEDLIIEKINPENQDDKSNIVGQLGYWKVWNQNNIYMIGITIGSDFWSCGYGQDAINTILQYFFMEKEAVKVELMVRETNPRAQRCYERCGFKKEVFLRNTDFAAGKTIGYHLMGVLREEFLARGDV